MRAHNQARRTAAGFRGCFAESKAASSPFAPPPPFYMRCSVGAVRRVRSNRVKPGQTKTCYRLQPPRVVQASTKHTIYEKFVCCVGGLRRFRSNPVKPSQTWSNQRVIYYAPFAPFCGQSALSRQSSASRSGGGNPQPDENQPQMDTDKHRWGL